MQEFQPTDYTSLYASTMLNKNLVLPIETGRLGVKANQRTRIGQVWHSDPPNIMEVESRKAHHLASRAGDGGDPNNASKGYFRRLLYGFGARVRSGPHWRA